jgi:iron complex outermembrane receptor protein
MNNLRLRKFAAGMAAFIMTGLFAVSGFAQATAPKSDDQVIEMSKFVATGTYLPESGLVAASPIARIETSQVGQSGSTDVMLLLKQMTPYFSGNGSFGTESNNGYAGESTVALRNLTTLVLVNGQRLVTTPFANLNFSGAAFADLNTIPTAMIDHIDILKDGASTVYGSDAIGGVVNVFLKKDFNGFETGVRYSTTKNGDYKTRNAYVIGGASGPGFSITIGAQHFENTTLSTLARPLTDLSGPAINALGYNVTSTVFSGTISGRVGSDILAGSPYAVGAPGYKASVVTPPIKTNPNAAPQTLAQLEAAGIYIPISSTPAYAAAGNSTSIVNTTLFGNPLIVPTKRNEFTANADRELLGKNLEVFGDFMFSQTTNGGSGLAPAPLPALGPAGGDTLSIPANNPYNPFGIVLGVGQPSGAPTIRARLQEIGPRSSINETNTFRFVGGLKGVINENYSWEATYNYSRASLTEQILGGANGANMNLAMVPALDASGNYTYNAAGRPLSQLTDASGNNLPIYDYFALPGFNDPATLNALRTTMFQNGVTDLRDIGVRLMGKPFELPAGNLTFALGVETRVEDITSSVDGLFANGLALGYNAANSFAGGTRSTKGAFLELGVPLVSPKQNIPGIYDLKLTLADRSEKITPGGNANTPKFGLLWHPLDDSFVLRATYAKGFIAPSLHDLFGPAGSNSPSFTLPVGDGRSNTGGSSATQKITIQGSSSELSNPYLLPSHARSYTAGFVYSPRQIKGLSLTVDYYDVRQDKVGSIDYTAIIADLNAKGAASVYNQDPLHLGTGFGFADGSSLTSNAPNQVNSTNVGLIRVAKNPSGDQQTRGLDIVLDYRFTTASVGTFDVGAASNVLFDYLFRATSTSPYLQYARVFTDSTDGGAGASGFLPSYLIKPYINYTYKSFTGSLFMTYYPRVTVPGTLFAGASTTNDYTLNGLASSTPTYFTADLSVAYTIPDFGHHWLSGTTITVGANNVFNKAAPYIPGDGSFWAENNTAKGAYDIIGRFMFFELKKRF